MSIAENSNPYICNQSIKQIKVFNISNKVHSFNQCKHLSCKVGILRSQINTFSMLSLGKNIEKPKSYTTVNIKVEILNKWKQEEMNTYAEDK